MRPEVVDYDETLPTQDVDEYLTLDDAYAPIVEREPETERDFVDLAGVGIERRADVGPEWREDDRAGADPGVEEFEQFLSGLSNRDIEALEKYVVDDMVDDNEQERRQRQSPDVGSDYNGIEDQSPDGKFNHHATGI